MDNQRNIQIIGHPEQPQFYGGSGELHFHIHTHYFEHDPVNPEQHVEFRIPGNGPYHIEVKCNDVLVITKECDVCVDPLDVTEENCVITGVPLGIIDVRVYDSTPPDPEFPMQYPLDARLTDYCTMESPPTATMIAEVNPMGLDTSVVFKFGLTEACEREVPYGVINAGFDFIPVSKLLKCKKNDGDPIEFLEPDTTYFYKCIATNSLGTTPTPIGTFHTPSYNSAPVIRNLNIINMQ